MLLYIYAYRCIYRKSGAGTWSLIHGAAMDHSHTHTPARSLAYHATIQTAFNGCSRESFPFQGFPICPAQSTVFGIRPLRLFHMLLNTRGKLVAPRRSFEYKSTRGQQQQQRNNSVEEQRSRKQGCHCHCHFGGTEGLDTLEKGFFVWKMLRKVPRRGKEW